MCTWALVQFNIFERIATPFRKVNLHLWIKDQKISPLKSKSMSDGISQNKNILGKYIAGGLSKLGHPIDTSIEREEKQLFTQILPQDKKLQMILI